MFYLIYTTNTSKERTYQLEYGSNKIGRYGDNTVVIDDSSVSREHAAITITQGKITIKDLNSLNHTFVNQIQIESCQLQNGDLIRCGDVEFQFIEVPSSIKTSSPTIINSKKYTSEKIVKRFPLQYINFPIQELSSEPKTDGTVLKLQGQDANQQTVEKLKILLEVGKQLSIPIKNNLLLNKILDLLFDIVDVDRAAIIIVNETTQLLECQAVKYKSELGHEGQFYSKTIVDLVFESAETIVTSDAYKDSRFKHSDSVYMQAIRASICIPLKPRDKILGVLYIDNLSMSNVYSDDDVEFLTALVNQAAIAIENSQLYKKIQAEAVMRNKLERFFPKTVWKKLKEEGQLGIVDTEVTALFADISGFTKMSSTMEPRQVISMLNEYFQVVVEDIIFQYEGTLEKYIGDALFAIWGAPYKRQDDTERAVQAAIDMQWAVLQLNERWKQQGKQTIKIHIGLNRGNVAAGNIGSERLIQYATIGNTTNITSRICNVAQAEEIVVSQLIFECLQNRGMPFEKMPLKEIKGKDKLLQLYRLHWKQLPSRFCSSPFKLKL